MLMSMETGWPTAPAPPQTQTLKDLAGTSFFALFGGSAILPISIDRSLFVLALVVSCEFLESVCGAVLWVNTSLCWHCAVSLFAFEEINVKPLVRRRITRSCK